MGVGGEVGDDVGGGTGSWYSADLECSSLYIIYICIYIKVSHTHTLLYVDNFFFTM